MHKINDFTFILGMEDGNLAVYTVKFRDEDDEILIQTLSVYKGFED